MNGSLRMSGILNVYILLMGQLKPITPIGTWMPAKNVKNATLNLI